MYIIKKEKKQLNWSIPMGIGFLAGFLTFVFFPQTNISGYIVTFLVALIGACAFSAHIYGIINMILNKDFLDESYNYNRFLIQFLYFVLIVPISYWTLYESGESVHSIFYFIFNVYFAFFLAALIVIITSVILTFFVDFLIYSASEFPYKLNEPIKYDVSSVCFSTIPVSIVLAFVLSFFIFQNYFSVNNYLNLWLLLPVIVVFSVDLNCFLIRSLPVDKISRIRLDR